jgi:hypothetical protein
VSWLLFVAFACGPDADDPPVLEAHGEPFQRCAILDPSGEEEWRAAGRKFTRKGFDLTVSGDGDGKAVFLALAGIEEAAEDDLANVRTLVELSRERALDAVLVAGGVGPDEAQSRTILGALGALPVPILVTIGESEPLAGYRAALRAARRRAPQLVDMSRIRRAELPDLRVVSLPGYHEPHYLRQREEGCGVVPEDAAILPKLAERLRAPVVVLSPAPPRGDGPFAVDRARGGVNIGSRPLARAMRKGHFAFGVFGHVYEAGGSATRADGRTRVAPGESAQTLWVNPGAVEAILYELSGGGRSQGMAAIVEIEDGRGKFRVIRAR